MKKHTYSSRAIGAQVAEPIAAYPIPEFTLSFRSNAGDQRVKIDGSRSAAEVFRRVFNADTIEWHESMIVLCLNRANEVIGMYKLSSGGVSGTVADPRMMFQTALLSNASSIILAHNHPSGNLKASESDIQLTKRVRDGGKLLEIQLLDHLIITATSHYSMADEGVI